MGASALRLCVFDTDALRPMDRTGIANVACMHACMSPTKRMVLDVCVEGFHPETHACQTHTDDDL